jgi:hypothetical protein
MVRRRPFIRNRALAGFAEAEPEEVITVLRE